MFFYVDTDKFCDILFGFGIGKIIVSGNIKEAVFRFFLLFFRKYSEN